MRITPKKLRKIATNLQKIQKEAVDAVTRINPLNLCDPTPENLRNLADKIEKITKELK